VQSLQGNYNGPPPNPVYPLEGIEKRFGAENVRYAPGSSLVDGFAMPISHTALHPAMETGEGLTGEYFSNIDFSGKPVLTRTDRLVNFNWDKVVPVPGLQRNNYSVRWTGTVIPPGPGDYRIGVRVNYCYACENTEAFNLYLDDKLLVKNGARTGERGAVIEDSVHFTDTLPHKIRLDYVHHTGSAGIDLTWQAPATFLRDQAVAVAKDADVIVAMVGLSPGLEGEEMPIKLDGFSSGDRTSIELPVVQQKLLEALGALHKPLIVVSENGSALALNWAAEHADAVLEAWYPGEEGGTAIAETLAGDNNPAGRLPLTFYRSLDQVPPFDIYDMKGRTYRYFEGQPLFRFGDGLSYTSFAYSALKVPTKFVKGTSFTVETNVRNTGKRAGDEVAELYVTQPRGFETPLRILAGFQRVHLEPGKTVHLNFSVDPNLIAQVDKNGRRVLVDGEYVVSVGGAQPGDPSSGASGRFSVVGLAK
jgi:beta-glucosidase